MSKYRVERLKSISDEDLKYLIDMTAELFENDPGCEVYMSGDPSLGYYYWSAYIRATILEGELWAVTVPKADGRQIVSWSSWFAPGTGLWATEAQRELGFNDFYEKCSPELQHWMWNTRIEHAKKIFDAILTPEEQKNYWNCCCIATHPGHHKLGYGSALLKIGFKKAEEAKNLVLLISTDHKNVPILTSMGVKVEGGGLIPSTRESFYAHFLIRRP